MHEQMPWSVGPTYLQEEITEIISIFKEVFSLIPAMTWKLSLIYYPMALFNMLENLNIIILFYK